MQGGQGQGCVLPAPRVVRSGTPLVTTIAAVAALVVVVVVSYADVVVVVIVAVVVEDDGLRFSSRRVLGFLPGIRGGRSGCPPVESKIQISIGQ